MILTGAGVGIALALVVSLINIGGMVPSWAMNLAPYAGGPVKARLAAAEITRGVDDRDRRRRAEVFAQAALVDDPANVVAARSLALVAAAQGQQNRSLRLFRYAERLSRRDLPTELALIEIAVQAGDVAGALRHYDRALRVFPRSADILLPVLDQAAAAPAVTAPLARLLRERPAWRPWFLTGMAGDPAASSAVLADLLYRIRPDPGIEQDRQVLERSLARLVRDRDYRTAYRLYRIALPSSGAALVRNGGFDRDPLLPPFDWMLNDTGGIRERVPGADDYALRLMHGEEAGEAARQLLILPPAAYRLAMTVGDGSGEGSGGEGAARPTVTIACADGGQALARISLPPADRPATVAADLTVPSRGCPAQWLIVAAGTGPDQTGPTLWVDRIVVTPR